MARLGRLRLSNFLWVQDNLVDRANLVEPEGNSHQYVKRTKIILNLLRKIVTLESILFY